MSFPQFTVTTLPAAPDRLLVANGHGGFTAMSIERFVAMVVSHVKEECRT